MSYRNPFHIFRIPWDSEPTSAVIRNARKRALAEFELTQQASVQFSGGELTQSEVLDLFDSLAKEKVAQWYWQLAHNRDLETFLLQVGKDVHPPEFWGPLEENDYREFLSPWLIPAIRQAFAQAVESQQAGATRSLFEAMPHFSRGQQAEMLRPVLEALQTMTDRIRYQIADSSNENDLAQGILYATAPYLAVFHNHLPSTLTHYREGYAEALQGLAQRLQQENHPKVWVAALHETVLTLDLVPRWREPSQAALLALASDSRIWRSQLETWLKDQKLTTPTKAQERSNIILGCVVILVLLALGIWLVQTVVRSCSPKSVVEAILPVGKFPTIEFDTISLGILADEPATQDSVGLPVPKFPSAPLPPGNDR